MEHMLATDKQQKLLAAALSSLCKLSDDLLADSAYGRKFHILALYMDRNSQKRILEAYLDEYAPKTPLRDLILQTASRPTRSLGRKMSLPALRTNAVIDSSAAETERLLRAVSPRDKVQVSPRRQVPVRRNTINGKGEKPARRTHTRAVSMSYSSNEWHYLSSILAQDDLRLSAKGIGRATLYRLAEQFEHNMQEMLTKHKTEFALIQSLAHKDIDGTAFVKALVHLYKVLERTSGLSEAIETELVMYAYTNRHNTELRSALVDKIEEALSDGELVRIVCSTSASDFWLQTARRIVKEAAKMFCNELVHHTKDSKPTLRLSRSKGHKGAAALVHLFVQAARSFQLATNLSEDHLTAMSELQNYLVLFSHLLVLTSAHTLDSLSELLSLYHELLTLLRHKAAKSVQEIVDSVETADT